MPGIDDCLTKAHLGKEVEAYIHEKAKPFMEGNVSIDEAYKKAVREFQEETLDGLQDLYTKVGISGHEVKPEEKKESGVAVILPEENKPPVIVPLKKVDETPVKKTEAADKQDDKQKTDEGKPDKPTIETGEGAGEPPKQEGVAAESGNSEPKWTAIRKEELIDAKKFAEAGLPKGSPTTWRESIDRGLNTLAAEASPNQSIYDVAKNKVESWGKNIEQELKDTGKSSFNPNDEEIAQILYYKTATEQKMGDLHEAMFSPIEVERQQALSQFLDLQQDNLVADYVLRESGRTGGRSFGLRQVEGRIDPETGLNIRRMEVSQGLELSSKEDDKISELYDKEREVNEQLRTQLEKFSEEEFNKRVEEEVKKRMGGEKPQTDKKGGVPKDKAKSFADRLRSAAQKVRDTKLGPDLPEGTKASGFTAKDLQEAVAKALDFIADGVEKLGRLPELIEEAIGKFKGTVSEDELMGKLKEGLIESGFSKSDVDAIPYRKGLLEKISEHSKNENSNTITKASVKKGLITDLIHDYADSGMTDTGKIMEQAKKDLSALFPGITDREIRDAYLKEGAYELPTQKQLENTVQKTKNDLKSISKIQSDLEDLQNKQTVLDRGNRSTGAIDVKVGQKREELKKALNKAGIQVERGNTFERAQKESLAQLHNDRIKSLQDKLSDRLSRDDVSDKEKSMLRSVNDILDKSYIDVKTIQDINQQSKQSTQKLKAALSEVRKELTKTILNGKSGNKTVLQEMSDDVERLIKSHEKDKEKTEIDIRLDRYKNRLRSKISSTEREIAAGLHEDAPRRPLLKRDAEIVKLEIEKRKIESEYRKMAENKRLNNRTKMQRLGDLLQNAWISSLISGPNTALKVGFSGLAKPVLETATRATTGQLAGALFPSLKKAIRGEGFSLRQEKNRYQAMFGAMGKEGMKKRVEKSEAAFKEAANNFSDVKKEADGLKEKFGEDSKEYKRFVRTDLKKSLNDYNKALLDHTENSLYEWIGGNTFKDSADIFINGTSQIEELFGYTKGQDFKGARWDDKISYVLNVAGRIHSIEKNFSGRAEFAADFVARLENKLANEPGINITDPTELLKIADESFINGYQRGKYQGENALSSALNDVISKLENASKEGDKHGKAKELAGRALKFSIPIRKVPVNIAIDAILEYTFGVPIAAYMHSKEAIKGFKQGYKEADKEKLSAGYDTMQKTISEMPFQKADLIYRSYRKGLFGGLLFTLGALGYIKFGGFYRQGQPKKDEGELPYNEVEVFGWRPGKAVSKVFTHTAVMMPSLLGSNYEAVKDIDMQKRGLSEPDAKFDAIESDLLGMWHSIPLSQATNPIEGVQNATLPFAKIGGELATYYDVDKDGNTIERKPLNFMDRFKMSSGIDRKSVPTKEAADEIKKIEAGYRQKRKDFYESGATKEEMDQLEKERMDEIEQAKKEGNERAKEGNP